VSQRPNTPFSAGASLSGYLFQCRYALLESLRRLRTADEFTVSIETLDDVVFEAQGEAPELLQTKHHLNRASDLSDASPDLWKTIRVWAEGWAGKTIPEGSTFILITTAQAAAGSAAHYLKAGESRDVDKAIARLNATSESSTNKDNKLAYAAYKNLDPAQKSKLLNAAVIIDSVPPIDDMDAAFMEVIFYAVEQKYLESYLQRLEGWWLRRVIKQLTGANKKPILSEELLSETTHIREQFKQDNLPIDDDIMSAYVDASGYQDMAFVHQLRLIEIGNPRIIIAIRNYFRAFEHRSRWMREDLLLIGELDRYEERLVEEWDILFQQMRDELGEEVAEEAKRKAAQALYKWVETGSHHSIRTGVTEPSIARGTYHRLADNQRVGWHPDYIEMLKKLLEPQQA
jgi:hypothetical protein